MAKGGRPGKGKGGSPIVFSNRILTVDQAKKTYKKMHDNNFGSRSAMHKGSMNRLRDSLVKNGQESFVNSLEKK